jgi:hypothetical protein
MKKNKIADMIRAALIVVTVFGTAALVGYAIMPNVLIPIGVMFIVLWVLVAAFREEMRKS